jgi:N,N'-diacetyllegionaminate synthase
MVDGPPGSAHNKRNMSIRIIAEIGVNHNGNIALARELVIQAKACGADIVKFQTFSADRLAAVATPKVPYQLRTSDPKESHHAMLKKLELSTKAHIELKAFCDHLGIEFCSTPYSLEDAEFLNELGVARFKVASADIIDRKLNEFIAGTGKECLLSVGMATMEEISATLELYDYRNSRNQVILLQCVSAYPAEPSDLNIRVMETLRNQFNCRVGFSDHTRGVECAIASAALGACVIEKHFTLDKEMPGPDHAASSTPEEFDALVKAVRTVEKALGDGIKRICHTEEEMRTISRKSIVAARDLPTEHILTEKDLAYSRPGSGISPMQYPMIVGHTLKVSKKKGEQMHWEELDV